MPFGFRAVGDHGVVQIDDTYTNLALKQAGSVFVPANTDVGVTVNGLDSPIICVRTPNGDPVFVGSNQALPNVTYTFRSSSAGSVEWFVFDKTVPTPTGFGMTIYKANGEPAYSTSWKLMKVGAVGGVPNLNPTPNVHPVATLGAPYSATWAACLTAARISYTDGGGSGIGTVYYDGVSMSGNVAQVSGVSVDAIPNDGSGQNIQPVGGLIILVDVSGFL